MPDELPVMAARVGLSKEQKIGFFLLLIFAIVTLAFGFFQIRNTFYGPFALNNKVAPTLKNEVNSLEALRLRDTDHDEINDFDELYIYGTSPYLYDTFSYGMSDKEVIAKKLPLCPKGQDCANPIASGDSVPSATASSALANLPPLGTPPPDLMKLLQDPQQVRQLLLSSGTDPKLLKKVSDADIMLVLQQVLSNSSTRQGLEAINGLIPKR